MQMWRYFCCSLRRQSYLWTNLFTLDVLAVETEFLLPQLSATRLLFNLGEGRCRRQVSGTLVSSGLWLVIQAGVLAQGSSRARARSAQLQVNILPMGLLKPATFRMSFVAHSSVKA